ncbi:MAG: DNA repair protein RecN [Eggerthellaceae bacterium]|nr:DNA repair protein RecN [Eggerthellaceae bacterium]
MIDQIDVVNVASIKSASLIPGKALTVVTGETGVGKTALINAIKILIGEKADKDVVRSGESELCVTGRLYQSDKSADESDLYDEDGFLIVQRKISSDGRSRVTVNGSMATVGELASCVAPSIDLCGQHEHQNLMKVSNHARLLNEWAKDNLGSLKEAYTEAFLGAKAAKESLDLLISETQNRQEALADAQYVIKRIGEVNPQPGEYETLLEQLRIAQSSEALLQIAHDTHDALVRDGGINDLLAKATYAWQRSSTHDENLDKTMRVVLDASVVLEDAAQDIERYCHGMDFDEAWIEEAQNRIAAMQGLMRIYGPRPEDVFGHLERAREKVAMINDADEHLEIAAKTLDLAETTLEKAARAYASAQEKFAPLFADAVSNNMSRLEMGSASLVCEVQLQARGQWNQNNPCHVEFMFKPASGMDALSLAKIASGGEVSRVMLAIKAVLGAADNVETLIFDEIDAGVGGSAAHAIASLLSDLAKTHQVIVVTHLAQIAAYADTHYVASKSSSSLPETTFSSVEGQSRVEEIARMLSGKVTEASLAHARELLFVG